MDEAQERSDERRRAASPGTAAASRRPSSPRCTPQVEDRPSELAAIVDELQELGVQVKDLDSGLVDFPSSRDGEQVLLCWRLGEDEIAFWHGLDDGFAGRQPL